MEYLHYDCRVGPCFIHQEVSLICTFFKLLTPLNIGRTIDSMLRHAGNIAVNKDASEGNEGRTLMVYEKEQQKNA